MKIIDAHMHYYNVDGFVQVAANAGYENTAACWHKICEENNIVFSVAMGNTNYTSSKYGGVTPRMIDLAAPFDEEHYNQPQNMGYCMGVNSEAIIEANAEKTAQESFGNNNVVCFAMGIGINLSEVNILIHIAAA